MTFIDILHREAEARKRRETGGWRLKFWTHLPLIVFFVVLAAWLIIVLAIMLSPKAAGSPCSAAQPPGDGRPSSSSPGITLSESAWAGSGPPRAVTVPARGLTIMGGCGVRAAHETLVLPLLPAALNDRPDHPASRPSSFRVTAYCPCRLCCGPRACGITASGSRADHPLVAAPRSIPFGTVLAVPGYGRVKVEDRGGAIGDGRLDVLMPTHAEALAWGVKYLEIDT